MKKLFALVLVAMVLLSAGFDVYLPPLLYTLTPLQRYYLSSYLASSWHEKDSAAKTEVEWIWKLGPKKQYAFATEQDLFPIPPREQLWKGGILPFWMTRKAEADGWKGIYRGPRIEVNSAQLATLLRQDFFDGEPAWRFFVQPVLMLATAVLLWLLIRTWLDERRERNYWGKPVPVWQDLGQKVLASGAGLKKSLEAQPAQLALPAPAPKRVIVTRTVAKPTAAQAPKPAPVQPAVAPVEQSKPTAPVTVQVKPKQTFWDESKGID